MVVAYLIIWKTGPFDRRRQRCRTAAAAAVGKVSLFVYLAVVVKLSPATDNWRNRTSQARHQRVRPPVRRDTGGAENYGRVFLRPDFLCPLEVEIQRWKDNKTPFLDSILILCTTFGKIICLLGSLTIVKSYQRGKRPKPCILIQILALRPSSCHEQVNRGGSLKCISLVSLSLLYSFVRHSYFFFSASWETTRTLM